VLLTVLAGLISAGCDQAPPSDAPAAADRLRLLVDTDLAADDITAIASLVRDPSVELLAITVAGTGEAHCDRGTYVARSIVTMLTAKPLPVACGRPDPLGDAQPFPASWRDGVDAGYGLDLAEPAFEVDPRAAEAVIVDLASTEAAAGGRLTILTLGTLTNLAGAVQLDPALPDRVRVVAMLGALAVPGNVTPEVVGGAGDAVAEWNAHADPTAVRVILEAGFDLTLVPLDATNDVPGSVALFQELASSHSAGPADLVFELWAKNTFMWAIEYYLWDPLASVAVRDPAVISTRSVPLTVVEGDGLDGGRLVEDDAGAEVRVAASADRARFEAFLLEELRRGAPRVNPFTLAGTVAIRGGGETCEATLDPATLSDGWLLVEVENVGSELLNVVVFELADVTWEDVEAYVESFDAEVPPPPVHLIAQLNVEGHARSTGSGSSPAGMLGVACLSGAPDSPSVRVAGPFPIGS
jgi:pyrimidine-specific ribonucleoside hydrolase